MKKAVALLTAISALLVSSVTMSLAWFATGNNAYVTNIELGVDVTRDFKITTEDNTDNLVERLGKDDLQSVAFFTPVSSQSTDWIAQEEEKPVFMDRYTKMVDSMGNPFCNAAEGGFFSQTLYLYLDYNMTVTLDSAKTYVRANEQVNAQTAVSLKNTKYPEYSLDAITANLNKVADSLRISILDYSNAESPYSIIDPRKDGETVYGGRLDNIGGDGYYDYYVANDGESYEILYGEYDVIDQIPYLPVATTDSHVEGEPTCFNARTKAGVHAIDMEHLDEHVRMKTEKSLTLEQADATLSSTSDAKPVNITLRAYELRKIVLSFYLEGWDLDNTDFTIDAAFSINVAFKLNREYI